MWIRFNKKFKSNPKYSIVWVEWEDGEALLIKRIATRCTGPDGIAYGEAAPEDILKEKKINISKIEKKKRRIKEENIKKKKILELVKK